MEKSQKNNKRAGGNKAVQVGIFQNSLVKNHKKWKNFEKLINVQEVIRACRLEIFKKIIICAARLLDTLEISNWTIILHFILLFRSSGRSMYNNRRTLCPEFSWVAVQCSVVGVTSILSTHG